LLVVADEKIRLERLINRSNLSLEYAKKRITAQISQEEKIKLADFVINNSENIEHTKTQLEEILKQIKIS